MKSIITRKEKIIKSSELEPNRTRWRIYAICSRCDNEFSKLNKVDTTKYCGSCENQLTANTKWLVNMYTKYNNRFNYSKVKFTTGTAAIILTCKKHGDFSTTPYHMLNPNKSLAVAGCPSCNLEFQKTKNSILTSTWKKRIYAKVKDDVKLLVEEEKPLLLTNSVNIECKTHGVLRILVRQINSGKLVCPSCGKDENSFNSRWYRTDIPGKVYFMYLPKIKKWKLGVTHRDVRKRRKELGGKAFCEIQWVYNTKTLRDAYLLEHEILKLHKQDRYTGPKLFDYGGHTELLNVPLSELTEGFVEEILRLNEPKTGNSDH